MVMVRSDPLVAALAAAAGPADGGWLLKLHGRGFLPGDGCSLYRAGITSAANSGSAAGQGRTVLMFVLHFDRCLVVNQHSSMSPRYDATAHLIGLHTLHHLRPRRLKSVLSYPPQYLKDAQVGLKRSEGSNAGL